MDELPSLYQAFIHCSRYARWLPQEKRRETWCETVDRYIEYMCRTRLEGLIDEETVEEIRKAILSLEVMPSMRALMTAGAALSRDEAAGYNCLSGETLVTTREEGIVPIESLAGSSVHVVDGNGQWTLAECRCYGERDLWEIGVTQSGRGEDLVFRCSADHDWILRDGQRKRTDELGVGDKLACVGFPEVAKWGFGTISRVGPIGEKGQVYCFEVPTTHSFLLYRNVLTGNCSFAAVDDYRVFDEALYLLMCVPEDTWVSTSFGPRQVKDLVERPFVAQVAGAPYFSRTGFFKTGERQLLVITAEGFEVRVTDNHEVMTSDGWKRADAIRVGEKVALGEPKMPRWDGAGTEDEGYLLGYFVGDGNFGWLGKMELASYEPDDEASVVRAEIQRIVLSLPGRSDRQGWSWDGSKKGFRLIDRQGAVLAARFGLRPDNKSIGREIEMASYDFCVGFIRGVMDADGCVLDSHKDRGVQLKWVDYRSLQAVQRMLARIGVKSRIVDGPDERDEWIAGKRVHCQKQWILKIAGEDRERYAELVGFLNKKKSAAVNSAQRAGYRSQRFVEVKSIRHTDEPVPVYDVQVDDIHAFDGNGLMLHNCGTGFGFSVERQFVNDLPSVPASMVECDDVVIVRDSRIGWAKGYRELVRSLYAGRIPKWDTSRIRPAGARLKTFGGRASGPGPLIELFKFTVDLFRQAAGRNLTSIECHDLLCKIGQVVVVGGVRRSALLSLSNPSDDRMRYAKSGEWWKTHDHRSLANNSAAWTEKPSMEVFMREWLALFESKSGERGIFNRKAALAHMAKHGRRETGHDFGLNPCGEIILRSAGLCNLSEVVVRPSDTLDDLRRKVRLATILGTMQATLTGFRYLRAQWKRNAEEEALLGVSLTGVMDNALTSGARGMDRLADALECLRFYTHEVNAEWADKFGINRAAATTCQKPSGCRPWDELVTTTEGILTLEEMFDGHQVGHEWGDYSGGARALVDEDTSRISRTYVNGEAEVFEVEMSFGLTVRSTANHKWFVKGGDPVSWTKSADNWLRTDELQRGHILDVRAGVYRQEQHSTLCPLTAQSLRMRGDATEIKQPDAMNEELAWFLGYLWGDGAQSPEECRIRFTDENEEAIRKAAGILRSQWGVEAEPFRAHDGHGAWQMEVGSKMLWHWLIRNDVWKCYADEIDLVPQVVRRSSWQDIVAFFSGMVDSGGWVNLVDGKVKVILGSSCETLSRHLQQVAWSVGLCFDRSKNVRGDNLQAVKDMYLMTLCGNTCLDAARVLSRNSVKMRRFPNHEQHATSRVKTLISGEIKAIRSIGVMPTYDIETDCHWFLAGAVKSHNTVSQLADCASGIHPRFSQHYIRRVRADVKDPLAQLMREMGFPNEPDVSKPEHQLVFSFPVESPAGALTRDDLTALEHLDIWLCYREHWTEHNPSMTCQVRDHEWMEVGAWVYRNFDRIGGVTFLPYAGHIYRQAPYEPVSDDEYVALREKMPDEVDWTRLAEFEESDHTVASQEIACAGNSCEIVDLVQE